MNWQKAVQGGTLESNLFRNAYAFVDNNDFLNIFQQYFTSVPRLSFPGGISSGFPQGLVLFPVLFTSPCFGCKYG